MHGRSDSMRVLRNQPMMKEGILPYNEKGKVVYKFKDWENIKHFAGKQAFIVDGHPDSILINGNTQVFGRVEYHLGTKGEHVIYGDLYLEDDAPDRSGYSQCYTFEPVDKKGLYNNDSYDMVQWLNTIDHCALTNNARDPNAMKVAGDELTFKNQNDKNAIDIKNVIYTKINTFDNGDLKMTVNADEYISQIKDLTKTNTKLEADFDSYKLKTQTDIDSFKKEIASITGERDALKTNYDSLKVRLDKIDADAKIEQEKEHNGLKAELKEWGYPVDSDEKFNNYDYCKAFYNGATGSKSKVVGQDEKGDKNKKKYSSQYKGSGE